MTSPSARVASARNTGAVTVSLMNRTEPSQSRNPQPPGCKLAKPSAPAWRLREFPAGLLLPFAAYFRFVALLAVIGFATNPEDSPQCKNIMPCSSPSFTTAQPRP